MIDRSLDRLSSAHIGRSLAGDRDGDGVHRLLAVAGGDHRAGRNGRVGRSCAGAHRVAQSCRLTASVLRLGTRRP